MNHLHKIPATQLIAALSDHPDLQKSDPQAIVNRVLKLTSAIFKISVADILSSSRSPVVANPRMIAMAASYELGLTLKQTGKLFGNRDHSAVLHARKRSPQLCDLSSHFADSTRNLRTALALSPHPPQVHSQSSVKSRLHLT